MQAIRPSSSVLVLGLGASGLAMARWCARSSAACRVVDTRSEPPGLASLRGVAPQAQFSRVERFDAALLDGVDLVLRSPGLPPAQWRALQQACTERGVPFAGELDVFLAALAALREERDYRPKLVAVTGTNGKTTVTRMVEHLARRSGIAAQAAGNIGPPLLDALADALDGAERDASALPQLWALELSSFQLYGIDGFEPDAAALLNLTQDHLDWHGDMADYAAAKARIFGARSVRVVCRDDALALAAAQPAPGVELVSYGSDAPSAPGCWGLVDDAGLQWLAYLPAAQSRPKPRRGPAPRPSFEDGEGARLQRLMPVDALPLAGRHNALNALAALALLQAVGLPLASLLQGLRSFKGEPHRLERLDRTDAAPGVDWYDDSKGTNVGATVAALDGLGRKVVLIAGGLGKGQDFAPLVEPVARQARAVLLIGTDAARIAAALAASGVPLEHCATLEAAVRRAAQLAQPGDAVLLSPACASTDMFDDYAHRGRMFAAAVQGLGRQQETAA
jgi:UDP-N-acetylmuramoylalanine--D-glutamate ligase